MLSVSRAASINNVYDWIDFFKPFFSFLRPLGRDLKSGMSGCHEKEGMQRCKDAAMKVLPWVQRMSS
jgi:hypothetical protein